MIQQGFRPRADRLIPETFPRGGRAPDLVLIRDQEFLSTRIRLQCGERGRTAGWFSILPHIHTFV